MVLRVFGEWPSSGRSRRLVLVMAVLSIATVLALPAAIYAWRHPAPATILSTVLAVGFYGAVLTFVRRVWVQLLIAVPILILNVIEIVHILIYGSLISLGGIEAILHVDPHEAREFVSGNAGVFVVAAAAVLAFVMLLRLRGRLDDLQLRERLVFGGVLVVAPAMVLLGHLWVSGSRQDVYLPTRIAEHFVAHLGANPLTHTVSGLAATIASRSELGRARDIRAAHRFDARRHAVPAERELYVLVIGESSRRRSWGLYGYGRPTSPRLEATPNLFAFSDATSPATVTTPSIALSLSLATPETMDLFHRTRSIVSAFRETGFKTFWLSNQGAHRSAVGNEIALMMEEADIVRTSNFGFWNSVLDEKLLPLLDEAIGDPAPRKLIIIHTLGSHTNYRQRVPPGFALGPGAANVREAHANIRITDEHAAIIEHYDRTIAYTDWFLGEVIARHRTDAAYGAVVYYSDHGQRLYDDGDFQRGHGFRTLKPEDVEVPLLVWLSDTLVRADPARRGAVAANTARPVSTGRMAESLLDLAAIDVGQPIAAQSFLGAAFRPEPRTVFMSDKIVVPCCGGGATGAPVAILSGAGVARR